VLKKKNKCADLVAFLLLALVLYYKIPYEIQKIKFVEISSFAQFYFAFEIRASNNRFSGTSDNDVSIGFKVY